MISVWRLTAEKLIESAFTGEGSKKYGGRWNSIGVRVVYTAESLSLAAFEVMVHGVPYHVLSSHVYIRADVPEDLIQTIDIKTLPEDWKDNPPSSELKQIGDEWIKKEESAILKVPSVILPEGHNYLINPTHADFSKIEIAEAKPFFLDERLKKVRAKIPPPLSITSYDPYIYKPVRVPNIKVKLTRDGKIESIYLEKKKIKIPETSKAEVVSIESLLKRKPKKS